MDTLDNIQNFGISSIEQTGNQIALVSDEANSNMQSNSNSLDVGIADSSNKDAAPAAQETDDEALSSLLMLSKSNADQTAKQYSNKVRIVCITKL